MHNIAIDMMGGDFGLTVTVPSVLKALEANPKLKLFLVGDAVAIKSKLNLNNNISNNIEIINTSQIVSMDEIPSIALRKKPDSSMRVALNLVKAGKADACVSAGNTGALMAIARFVLKTLPGISRPAILHAMPTIINKKSVSVLDLGANVDCSAEQLFQFAVMGSIFIAALGKPNPSIGLLNIGSEANKGTEAVKAAAEMISNNPSLNYIGFVEGDEIYQGKIDLVVCDGFVGNVVLKVTEGLAKLILPYIKQEFYSSWYAKIVGYLAKPIFNKIFHKFNPNKYNGASLLGLNGIVIKSHGSANDKAFTNAILNASLEAEQNIPSLIKDKVAAQLGMKVRGTVK